MADITACRDSSEPWPIRIPIVFHSGYGHTARQAEAVAQGVRRVAGAEAALLPVANVDRSWPSSRPRLPSSSAPDLYGRGIQGVQGS